MAHDMNLKNITMTIYENKNTNIYRFELIWFIEPVVGRGLAFEAGEGEWISRQHWPFTPTQAIDQMARIGSL
jgi:hypothetical protein